MKPNQLIKKQGTVQVWDAGMTDSAVFVCVSNSFYLHSSLRVRSRVFFFDNVRLRESLTIGGGGLIDMVRCFVVFVSPSFLSLMKNKKGSKQFPARGRAIDFRK